MAASLQSKEVFSIKEFVDNYSELMIVFYGILLLWINIDYLRDHKNIKKELKDLHPESEDEMFLDPSSFSVFLLRAAFDFIRRWFIYILAIVITENIFVIVISILLFLLSLYDIFFNYSLAKVAKSNMGFYLAIIDTILISTFIIYLFLYHVI